MSEEVHTDIFSGRDLLIWQRFMNVPFPLIITVVFAGAAGQRWTHIPLSYQPVPSYSLMYRSEEKIQMLGKRDTRRHVAGIPEGWTHWLHLTFKMYTESDYGGCLYLISLTFFTRGGRVPRWRRELAAFKCQTTRANDFYVLTCFNVLMTAGQKKKKKG